MDTQPEPKERETNLERRKREGQIWRSAFVISLGLHLLLFLLWPSSWGPESPFSAAGPRALDDRAAEGAMQAVSLSSAPPDEAQPPPVPVVTLDPPDPVEVEIEPDALPDVEITPPDIPIPGRDRKSKRPLEGGGKVGRGVWSCKPPKNR